MRKKVNMAQFLRCCPSASFHRVEVMNEVKSRGTSLIECQARRLGFDPGWDVQFDDTHTLEASAIKLRIFMYLDPRWAAALRSISLGVASCGHRSVSCRPHRDAPIRGSRIVGGVTWQGGALAWLRGLQAARMMAFQHSNLAALVARVLS